MNKYIERLYNGIIKENPTFVLLLGMCPTLAVTTSAINSIYMGITTMIILMLSNILISLIRKTISNVIRIPCFIVVIATFVTIIQLILNGFMPNLSEALGIYIPLIVVNCIILGRAESYASKNGIILSAFDGLGIGFGFTIALSLIGIIREFIGNGSIFGIDVISKYFIPITIFVLPPGAFLVLAFIIAFINKRKNKININKDCSNCMRCIK